MGLGTDLLGKDMGGALEDSAIGDMFSQQEVDAYEPNRNNFLYGGVAGGARTATQRQEGHAQGARDQGGVWHAQGNQFEQRGNQYYNLGTAAQGRNAPQVDLTQANFSRTGANAAIGQATDARASQLANADALRAFYQQGPGPSAAEAQLRMAQDQNAAQMLAMARSGRGSGASASASRQAMMQGADIGQRTAAELANLRANEAAQFRGQQLQAMGLEQQGLGAARSGDQSTAGLYSQLYGQDLGQAQFDANLAYQQGVQNDAFLTNMIGAQNQAGQLQLGAGNLELGFGGQALGYEQLGSSIAGQQLQADVAFEGMKSGNYMAAQQANAGYDAQRDASNLQMLAMLGAAASDRDAKHDVKPANEDLLSMFDSFSGSSPLAAGAAQGLRLRQAIDQEQQDPTALATYQAPQAPEQKQSGGIMAMLGGLMGGGGMTASDRETKRELREAESLNEQLMAALAKQSPYPTTQQPNTAALDAVRQAPGYSYEYRDPARHGEGRFYGPMAQDLERTPVGRSVVKQAPDGTKMVDTSRLTLVNTAAQSAQQQQLEQQQSELDEFKRALAELKALAEPQSDGFNVRRDFDREGLDEAYARMGL